MTILMRIADAETAARWVLSSALAPLRGPATAARAIPPEHEARHPEDAQQRHCNGHTSVQSDTLRDPGDTVMALRLGNSANGRHGT
jgi:hypothetical protein